MFLLLLMFVLEDASSIEAFRTDYQKAVDKVEFKATYETHRMTVASIDEALRQGMSRGPMTVFLGRGVLNKKGNLLRYSCEYAGNLNEIAAAGNKPPAGFQYVDFDEVTDGTKDLSFVRLQLSPSSPDRLFDTATFTKRKQGGPAISGAGPQSRSSISPLLPLPLDDPDLFRLPNILAEAKATTTERVGTEGVRMTFSQTKGKLTYTRTLEFELGAHSPQLTLMLEQWTLPSGLRLEDKAVLEDFIQLDGVSIARRVVYSHQEWQPSGTAGPLLVTLWQSKDLGEKEPRNDDFVIVVPPTTTVVGLAQKLEPGVVRLLDITSISSKDLIVRPVRLER